MTILSMSSPYCVPTIALDIIRAYVIWANENSSSRIQSYVEEIDYGYEIIPEIFEEYKINGRFLTSRIVNISNNYSIVLMESKQSNLDLIIADNNDDISDVDTMGDNSAKLKCNREKKKVSELLDLTSIHILLYMPFIRIIETSTETILIKQILESIDNNRSLIEEFKQTTWIDVRDDENNHYPNDTKAYSNILDTFTNQLEILDLGYLHTIA